jgi:hypothetical protein
MVELLLPWKGSMLWLLAVQIGVVAVGVLESVQGQSKFYHQFNLALTTVLIHCLVNLHVEQAAIADMAFYT